MKKMLKKNFLYWLYLVGFGVFFGRVWSLALFWDEVGLRSGWIASWADGAAHLSYMSSFAYREGFPIFHPLFLGKTFSYPYVADLLGGYLVKMGLPLHTSYNLLGFLFSMFLVIMVWKLYETLFGKKLASFVGSLIFFLGAGLTNLEKFVGPGIKPLFNTYDWVDIISAQIMPQRALILGMPIGIGIFIVMYKYISSQKSLHINKGRLLMAGIFTGLMSVIHTHTLMALFFLVGWLFVLDLVRNKSVRSGWFWYGIPTITLLTILLTKQVGSFDESFVRYLPLWLVKSRGENLAWFWVKSWGIWPLIVYLGFSRLKKRLKVLFVPLIVLFVLLNLFSFQPYDWDNTKLFLWIYLFFSGVAGVWISNNWKNKKWVSSICFLLLTFSGTMDAAKLVSPQKDPVLYLATYDDVSMARNIRENTDENSVFVASNYHLNLIPVFTGRQILMGYPGWLWTYGINYEDRAKEVEIIYRGGEKAMGLINEYGVSYVVFDDVVLGSIKESNEKYYMENHPIAFENGGYRIYKVR